MGAYLAETGNGGWWGNIFFPVCLQSIVVSMFCVYFFFCSLPVVCSGVCLLSLTANRCCCVHSFNGAIEGSRRKAEKGSVLFLCLLDMFSLLQEK